MPRHLQTFMILFLLASAEHCLAQADNHSSDLIQYGSMHETIGAQDHRARVQLAELVEQTHLYAVGAVEGLQGEITILDSKAIVTATETGSQAQPQRPEDTRATLLVGQAVPAWTSTTLSEDVPPDKLDTTLMNLATGRGLDTSQPFMFVLEGQFTHLRLHVINGACPVHARMRKLPISEEQKPFELETERIQGTVVGIFAKNAVGNLTHPATSHHAHLIYTDPNSGKQVTGHLEVFGVEKGTRLKVPKQPSTEPASELPGDYP